MIRAKGRIHVRILELALWDFAGLSAGAGPEGAAQRESGGESGAAAEDPAAAAAGNATASGAGADWFGTEAGAAAEPSGQEGDDLAAFLTGLRAKYHLHNEDAPISQERSAVEVAEAALRHLLADDSTTTFSGE